MATLPISLNNASSPITKRGPRKLASRSSSRRAFVELPIDRVFEDDAAPLLSPTRPTSDDAWLLSEKMVPFDASRYASRSLTLTADSVTGAVIVSSIDRTAPVAQAGLLVGDQLFSIDGAPVTSLLAATNALEKASAKGKRVDLNDTVAATRNAAGVMLSVSGSTRSVMLDKTKGHIGMSIGAGTQSRGVTLVGIQSGSLSDEAALYHGDTILSVNEQLVHTHEQAVALIDACQSEVRLVVIGRASPHQLAKLGVPTSNLSYVTATFGEGECGMTVKELRKDRAVRVKSVDSDGQAIAQGIKVDSMLLAVGDTSAVGLKYGEVLELMKTAPRPMRVLFTVPA